MIAPEFCQTIARLSFAELFAVRKRVQFCSAHGCHSEDGWQESLVNEEMNRRFLRIR